VCRGCALGVGGALLGVALAGSWPLASLRALAARGLLALAACVLLSVVALLARRSARERKLSKLVTRFAPAVLLAGVCTLGARRADPFGVALSVLSLAAIATAWIAYRRRGPDRAQCEACPEGPPNAGCSGFAPIVMRERAFQRLASSMRTAAQAQASRSESSLGND
jgi:hypothetical protein